VLFIAWPASDASESLDLLISIAVICLVDYLLGLKQLAPFPPTSRALRIPIINPYIPREITVLEYITFNPPYHAKTQLNLSLREA
jgi:hypothetical protein